MIFIAIPLLLFLVFFNIKIKNFNENDLSCLSKEQTSSINGIFALIILLAHFISYIPNPSIYDSLVTKIPVFGSQLIVVSFLFYSGYGLMESYKIKGNKYINIP